MTSTSKDRLFGANSSMAVKVPCRVATTAAITLSGEQTIDGVAVVTNDRVLVKDQSSGVDNGIYIADTSTWQRAPDFDGARDVCEGTLVKVNSGSTGAGFWYVTTTGTITPGTTSITFGAATAVFAVISVFWQAVLQLTTAAASRAALSVYSAAESLALFVGLTGDQSIAGVKTFTSKPVLPATTPTGNEAARAADIAAYSGPGIKQGLVLSNNGSDATNDIDIAAGKAVDTTGAVVMSLASTMVKQLDVNWAAGTNQGGRYSGASIANTTYHVWLVSKAAGADVDVYLDPSASASTVLTHLQAETGGSAYLYVWRIGSILRESAAIVLFDQDKDSFRRRTSILDVNATNPGASAVTRTLSVPIGIVVDAQFDAHIAGGTATAPNVYFSPLDATDETPSFSAAPLGSVVQNSGGIALGVGPLSIKTNTSAQIRSRLEGSVADTVLRVATLGWVDKGIYRS